MFTIEKLDGGRIQLNFLKIGGWERHVFEPNEDGKIRVDFNGPDGLISHLFGDFEQVVKYAGKCYNRPKECSLDVV